MISLFFKVHANALFNNLDAQAFCTILFHKCLKQQTQCLKGLFKSEQFCDSIIFA